MSQNRKQKGFTLIELMIVIAIIAIIAAIAIPNLLAARLSTNETAAVATLRNIISCQAQFQQGAKIDGNNNGTGEYGGFLDLSGAVTPRCTTALSPAVLSGAFRTLNATGDVSRSGYYFHMFLCDATGAPVAEPSTGFVVYTANDASAQETTWCCYAWPINYGQTGNRTFMTNQAGDIVGCEGGGGTPVYNGSTTIPTGDAAFLVGGTITGRVAIGAVGADGNTWKQVN